MGKKRNNATKKKQAAKKKKLSSAYGVSVQKGGTITRNNGVIEANSADGSGSSHANKQNGNAKRSASAQVHGQNGADANMSTNETSKRPRGNRNENDEFHRQQASLQERSLAAQAQKNDQRRSKKERQKRPKKGWGKFAGPTNSKFAPATLTLAPKTTQQLVDDAADQVAQGMNEIGQQAPNTFYGHAPAIPGQSSLAAAAGPSWNPLMSTVSNNEVPQQPQKPNNPFAALDHESDSDNEWADQKKKRVQQFQFQPASFSFQTQSKAEGPVFCVGDEYDPDL